MREEQTLIAVAEAYRGVRVAGGLDLEAWDAAAKAYRDLHPDDSDWSRRVSVLICTAANRWGQWLYRDAPKRPARMCWKEGWSPAPHHSIPPRGPFEGE